MHIWSGVWPGVWQAFSRWFPTAKVSPKPAESILDKDKSLKEPLPS
jgi:hypothetical protein